jgi:hypothetical protein
MTRALKGQIISGNGKAVAQRNAVAFSRPERAG